MNLPPDESLAAAAESPDFEAEEAKEVEVREEDEGKPPRILLKRQSKDETTGRTEFRLLSSLYFKCRKHEVILGCVG